MPYADSKAASNKTTLERWRLDTHDGDHQWRYLSPEEASTRSQTVPEKHFLGLPTVRWMTTNKASFDRNQLF